MIWDWCLVPFNSTAWLFSTHWVSCQSSGFSSCRLWSFTVLQTLERSVWGIRKHKLAFADWPQSMLALCYNILIQTVGYITLGMLCQRIIQKMTRRMVSLCVLLWFWSFWGFLSIFEMQRYMYLLQAVAKLRILGQTFCKETRKCK